MKAAIIQSCYVPWRGYFDIINDVDVFVFLDDVQLTKRDWRTRNVIKTATGPAWLTIPVIGGREQRICDAKIFESDWQKRHRDAIERSYDGAPHRAHVEGLLAWLYETPHATLSEFNQETTRRICTLLGITTRLVSSLDLAPDGRKDDRLIDICRKIGATSYLSGPSARDYIDPKKFADAGIALGYKSYAGYPDYPQLFPPFDPAVSILDLLLNCGPDSRRYALSRP